MTITLLQLTDTHIHDHADTAFKNSHPDASLNTLIQHAKINLKNIDYVMVTGDLTHDGTEESCKRLKSLLSQFDCPVAVTPGNHDTTTVIQQHLLNSHIIMPNLIETDYWQLLFADSHIENQAHGFISDNSLQRLSTQLHQCKKPALLFTHHPPVKINSAWMDQINMQNGAYVLQTLAACNNLRGIAFGHIHQQWHSQHQQIEILGTPSSCIQFKAGSDKFALDENFPGYRVFNLHKNGEFNSEVIRLKACP